MILLFGAIFMKYVWNKEQNYRAFTEYQRKIREITPVTQVCVQIGGGC